MNTRLAVAMSSANSSPTLNPVRDSTNINSTTTAAGADRDFAVPKLPHAHHDSLQVPRLPPPASSLSWALHGGAMGAPDGFGPALSDTPMASTPSTAPGSPRM